MGVALVDLYVIYCGGNRMRYLYGYLLSPGKFGTLGSLPVRRDVREFVPTGLFAGGDADR